MARAQRICLSISKQSKNHTQKNVKHVSLNPGKMSSENQIFDMSSSSSLLTSKDSLTSAHFFRASKISPWS